MLPLPKKLVKQGHRDMLRLSDARMSGTSYGACVLHVAPESFVGGPLALLRTGDIVRCDIPGRRIDMLVSDAELAAPARGLDAARAAVRAGLRLGVLRGMSGRPTRAATSTSCRRTSAGPPGSRTSSDAPVSPPRPAAGAAPRRSAARRRPGCRRGGRAAAPRRGSAARGSAGRRRDAVAVGADEARRQLLLLVGDLRQRRRRRSPSGRARPSLRRITGIVAFMPASA